MRALLLCGLCGAIAACATTASRLESRFAEERGCPESQVRVTELGANVYRVAGCDVSTEYVCGTFATAQPGAPCQERGPHQEPLRRDLEPLPNATAEGLAPGH